MWMDGTRTRRKFVKGEQSPCFQRNLNGILRLWASINFRQLRQVSNPAAEAAALKKEVESILRKVPAFSPVRNHITPRSRRHPIANSQLRNVPSVP